MPYSFTINRDQHATNDSKFLDSTLVNTRNLQSKITKEEAEEIARDFHMSKDAKEILGSVGIDGVVLKDFLNKIKEVCYSAQSVQDYPRTSVTITIKGQKIPIFQEKVFFDSQGRQTIDLNKVKEVVATEIDVKKDQQNLVSLKKIVQVLASRGIRHPEFVSNLFNQSTLNGAVIWNTVTKLFPKCLFSRPIKLNIQSIELDLNNEGEVQGLKVIQKIYRVEQRGKEEGYIMEVSGNNTIYCESNISIDPSQSKYLFGACKIKSFQTTFSSRGKLGQKILQAMENNLNQQNAEKLIEEFASKNYIEFIFDRFFDAINYYFHKAITSITMNFSLSIKERSINIEHEESAKKVACSFVEVKPENDKKFDSTIKPPTEIFHLHNQSDSNDRRWP